MTGTGEFSSVPEACDAAIGQLDSVTPRPAESALYARGHRVFQSLYPALAPIYPRMAAI